MSEKIKSMRKSVSVLLVLIMLFAMTVPAFAAGLGSPLPASPVEGEPPAAGSTTSPAPEEGETPAPEEDETPAPEEGETPVPETTPGAEDGPGEPGDPPQGEEPPPGLTMAAVFGANETPRQFTPAGGARAENYCAICGMENPDCLYDSNGDHYENEEGIIAYRNVNGEIYYLITNWKQLNHMRRHMDKNYELYPCSYDADTNTYTYLGAGSSLVIPETDDDGAPVVWEPVGYCADALTSTHTSDCRHFSGVFNGGGHTIEGLNVSLSDEQIKSAAEGLTGGLFGYVHGATITNLTISGASVTAKNYAGTLAAVLENTRVDGVYIEDARVALDRWKAGTSGAAGLLAGASIGTSEIINCATAATDDTTDPERPVPALSAAQQTTGDAKAYNFVLGGLVGLNTAIIRNGYFTLDGTIAHCDTKDGIAGGLAGRNGNGGRIENDSISPLPRAFESDSGLGAVRAGAFGGIAGENEGVIIGFGDGYDKSAAPEDRDDYVVDTQERITALFGACDISVSHAFGGIAAFNKGTIENTFAFFINPVHISVAYAGTSFDDDLCAAGGIAGFNRDGSIVDTANVLYAADPLPDDADGNAVPNIGVTSAVRHSGDLFGGVAGQNLGTITACCADFQTGHYYGSTAAAGLAAKMGDGISGATLSYSKTRLLQPVLLRADALGNTSSIGGAVASAASGSVISAVQADIFADLSSGKDSGGLIGAAEKSTVSDSAVYIDQALPGESYPRGGLFIGRTAGTMTYTDNFVFAVNDSAYDTDNDPDSATAAMNRKVIGNVTLSATNYQGIFRMNYVLDAARMLSTDWDLIAKPVQGEPFTTAAYNPEFAPNMPATFTGMYNDGALTAHTPTEVVLPDPGLITVDCSYTVVAPTADRPGVRVLHSFEADVQAASGALLAPLNGLSFWQKYGNTDFCNELGPLNPVYDPTTYNYSLTIPVAEYNESGEPVLGYKLYVETIPESATYSITRQKDTNAGNDFSIFIEKTTISDGMTNHELYQISNLKAGKNVLLVQVRDNATDTQKTYTVTLFVQQKCLLHVSGSACVTDFVHEAPITERDADGYYLISTPEQLFHLRAHSGDDQASAYKFRIKDGAVLDFSGWDFTAFAWTPIGDADGYFHSEFDGNAGSGAKVTGLNLNNPTGAAGLFNILYGSASVYDLDISVTDLACNDGGGFYGGAIAAEIANTATVRNVTVTIEGTVGGSTGGVVGHSSLGSACIIERAFVTYAGADIAGDNAAGLIHTAEGGTVRDSAAYLDADTAVTGTVFFGAAAESLAGSSILENLWYLYPDTENVLQIVKAENVAGIGYPQTLVLDIPLGSSDTVLTYTNRAMELLLSANAASTYSFSRVFLSGTGFAISAANKANIAAVGNEGDRAVLQAAITAVNGTETLNKISFPKLYIDLTVGAGIAPAMTELYMEYEGVNYAEALYEGVGDDMAFNGARTEYVLYVPNKVTTLDVTTVPAYGDLTITGLLGGKLSVGAPARYVITVDGVEYTITVIRRAACALGNDCLTGISDNDQIGFDEHNAILIGLEKYYVITDVRQLNHIRMHLDANFVLGATIDVSTLTGTPLVWTPIGTAEAPFTGKFEGATPTGSGSTVKQYKIIGIGSDADSTEKNVGLFGVIGESGQVRHVDLQTKKPISASAADSNVGVLAGINDGLIEHCTVRLGKSLGAVDKTGDQSVVNNAGAIAGINNGTINDVTVTIGTNVSIMAYFASAGGVAGMNGIGGVIKDASVEGGVTSKIIGRYYTGGIAGINFGTISASDFTLAAGGTLQGLVGYNYPDQCTGGIAGWNLDTITTSNVANSGRFIASECVGGIAGFSDMYSVLRGCNYASEATALLKAECFDGAYYMEGSFPITNATGGVAGILGDSAQVLYCSAMINGTLQATTTYNGGTAYGPVGGLVGRTDVNGLVTDSGVNVVNAADARTTWIGNQEMGGLIGENNFANKACLQDSFIAVPKGQTFKLLGKGSGTNLCTIYYEQVLGAVPLGATATILTFNPSTFKLPEMDIEYEATNVDMNGNVYDVFVRDESNHKNVCAVGISDLINATVTFSITRYDPETRTNYRTLQLPIVFSGSVVNINYSANAMLRDVDGPFAAIGDFATIDNGGMRTTGLSVIASELLDDAGVQIQPERQMMLTRAEIEILKANTDDANYYDYYFSPAYLGAAYNYTASVPHGVSYVTIDAECIQAVTGAKVVSGSGVFALAVGLNKLYVKTTAPDGRTKLTYTLNITRAPKSDNRVKEFRILSGRTVLYTIPVEYDAAGVPTLEYDLEVLSTLNTIDLAAVCYDATTQVTGTGRIVLEPGKNVLAVVASSKDGLKTDSYTLTLTRPEYSSSYLSELKVTLGRTELALAHTVQVPGETGVGFQPSILNYTCYVPKSLIGPQNNPVTISAKAQDAGAAVTGAGDKFFEADLDLEALVQVGTGKSATTYRIRVVQTELNDASIRAEAGVIVTANKQDYVARWDDEKNAYYVQIPYSASSAKTLSAKIEVTPNNANASVKIQSLTGATAKDLVRGATTLLFGEYSADPMWNRTNQYLITVTGENRTSGMQCRLYIDRLYGVTTFKGLTMRPNQRAATILPYLDNYALNLPAGIAGVGFSADYRAYDVYLTSKATTLTVNPAKVNTLSEFRLYHRNAAGTVITWEQTPTRAFNVQDGDTLFLVHLKPNFNADPTITPAIADDLLADMANGNITGQSGAAVDMWASKDYAYCEQVYIFNVTKAPANSLDMLGMQVRYTINRVTTIDFVPYDNTVPNDFDPYMLPEGVLSATYTPITLDPAASARGGGTKSFARVWEYGLVITVTAPDRTTAQYNFGAERPQSENSALASLSIRIGSAEYPLDNPLFTYDADGNLIPGYDHDDNPMTDNSTDYNIYVPVGDLAATATYRVSARADDKLARVTLIDSDGYDAANRHITPAATWIDITVTAEDGSTRVYRVNIVDTTAVYAGDYTHLLAGFSLTGGRNTYWVRDFEPDKFPAKNEYRVTVPYSVSSIRINGVRAYNRAVVTGNGSKRLTVGLNTFVIAVRESSKSATVTYYTLIIERMRNDVSTLRSLAVQAGNRKTTINLTRGLVTLDPEHLPEVLDMAGNPVTTGYEFTVAKTNASIVINAVATDANALIEGAGTQIVPYMDGQFYRDFVIKVTAENGTDFTYYILRLRWA